MLGIGNSWLTLKNPKPLVNYQESLPNEKLFCKIEVDQLEDVVILALQKKYEE